MPLFWTTLGSADDRPSLLQAPWLGWLVVEVL
jgi:hypothetical protein